MSEPNQTTGQFHSAKGNAVEAIGNMTGSDNWKASGKEEHAAGEGEVKAAQTKGYLEGAMDRAKGTFDSVVGSVTGDKTQQASGNMRDAAGDAKMEANKPV
ncbi:hypothetical protein C8F01DRAFT_1145127 [Mycena amicta]|nr:hypothetical protein C8F01DRAFT_1145127 [Mycena amicta]